MVGKSCVTMGEIGEVLQVTTSDLGENKIRVVCDIEQKEVRVYRSDSPNELASFGYDRTDLNQQAACRLGIEYANGYKHRFDE